MACIDNINGSGCLKCEIACKNSIEHGSDVRPFFDKDFQCKCKVCCCECSVVYFRHEAKKLARQRQLDYEKQTNSLSQPKLNSFFGFTDSLKEMTNSRLAEVESTDDAMAITACDLSSSKTLSGNVALRNTLQKCVGSLVTETKEGYSAAQLRAQKVKRRKVNRDRAMAALPIITQDSFDESEHALTITSNAATPVGTNNNSRWFRNGLEHQTKIEDATNASTITSSSVACLKSVISCDTERKSAVDSLRKKLIKRLIGVSSPTSEMKQNLFWKLIANEGNTRTVIEMAIEMESSIDDTKLMLMNNCSK